MTHLPPLGTPLGLAQRKRASPRGEAGTSGFLCVSFSRPAGAGIVSKNPRDGGAWWAAVYGVAQSWTSNGNSVWVRAADAVGTGKAGDALRKARAGMRERREVIWCSQKKWALVFMGTASWGGGSLSKRGLGHSSLRRRSCSQKWLRRQGQ